MAVFTFQEIFSPANNYDVCETFARVAGLVRPEFKPLGGYLRKVEVVKRLDRLSIIIRLNFDLPNDHSRYWEFEIDDHIISTSRPVSTVVEIAEAFAKSIDKGDLATMLLLT